MKRRDSGLGNMGAVDVTANDDGIPVMSIRNRDPESIRNPDKMWRSVTLSGGVRKALRRAETLLAAHPDPVKIATLRRVSALYKAKARKDRGVNHATIITAAAQ